MARHLDLGKEGEDFACKYLRKNGYRIVDRNVREKWGELDIVAKAKNGTLVFVEVKTMRGFNEGGICPENQMTPAKIKKFKNTAQLYAGHRVDLVNDEKGWRLDVVTLTKVGNDFIVGHYENI